MPITSSTSSTGQTQVQGPSDGETQVQGPSDGEGDVASGEVSDLKSLRRSAGLAFRMKGLDCLVHVTGRGPVIL